MPRRLPRDHLGPSGAQRQVTADEVVPSESAVPVHSMAEVARACNHAWQGWQTLGTMTEGVTYDVDYDYVDIGMGYGRAYPVAMSRTTVTIGSRTLTLSAGDTLTITGSRWYIQTGNGPNADAWDVEWSWFPRGASMHPPSPQDQRVHQLRRAEADARRQGHQLEVAAYTPPDWWPADATAVELAQVRGTFAAARAEQLQAIEARRAQEAAQVEVRRRAELLLLSVLTAAQKAEWLEHRYVTETAPSGRVWRFHPVRVGGVQLLGEDGRVRTQLCVHPVDHVPDEDQIAALLLAVRFGDEDHVLATANLYQGRWGPTETQVRRTYGDLYDDPDDIDLGGVDGVVVEAAAG